MAKAQPKKSTPKSDNVALNEVKSLIDFISHSGLNEVNIETSELKLHVKRQADVQAVRAEAPVLMPPVTVAPAQPAVAQVAKPAEAKPAKPATKTADIKSPMIGTFYRSSGPETAPFVSLGDKVTKGQVVCIIEAMKLFNEIESEVSGTIVQIKAENASPVEYDQVLFVVEPD